MLLEEFDANRQAIINPQDLHQPIEGFPKVVISCFSRVTFARLLENYDHEVIARTSMANFEVLVYGITIGDQQIGAFNAPVGAASCVGDYRGPDSIWDGKTGALWNLWGFRP